MILTSGCFDGIHAGHVAFFHKLKAITNQNAYVAVAPDAYIRTVKHREPRWPQDDRLLAVKGLTGVQDAFFHGPAGVEDIVRTGMPWAPGCAWTAFAKGADWTLKDDLLLECLNAGTAMIYVQSGYAGHNSDQS